MTDGGGMHLLVHPNGSKYWRLQYRYEGKQKMLALGVYPLNLQSKCNKKRSTHQLEYNFVSTQK
ncbi:Arm DNA-binding domain-containing protein, partial [Escherichia coli]|uniref:Arm DNA-binding domain-containing protein n=1 Tax=Escherichia coli TaxID=562 RepID=UPI00207C26ED